MNKKTLKVKKSKAGYYVSWRDKLQEYKTSLRSKESAESLKIKMLKAN